MEQMWVMRLTECQRAARALFEALVLCECIKVEKYIGATIDGSRRVFNICEGVADSDCRLTRKLLIEG